MAPVCRADVGMHWGQPISQLKLSGSKSARFRSRRLWDLDRKSVGERGVDGGSAGVERGTEEVGRSGSGLMRGMMKRNLMGA